MRISTEAYTYEHIRGIKQPPRNLASRYQTKQKAVRNNARKFSIVYLIIIAISKWLHCNYVKLNV
jgi:hypothetical protein